MLALLPTLVGYAAAGYLVYRAILALLRVRGARHAHPTVTPRPAPSDWHDRCRGALLGAAMGDALNLPAEAIPRWLARLRYPSGPAMRGGVVRFARRPGDVSDDTQLSICVARSISLDGAYHGAWFARELAQWSYHRIGAGRATTRAAVRLRRGGTPHDPPRASEGNGVAIRIAPLAIAMCNAPDSLVEAVEQNGRVTHGGGPATRGAVFVALLVRAALRLPAGALEDDETLARVVVEAAAVARFDVGPLPVIARAAPPDVATELAACGTSGHVHHTVRAALLVLWRHRLDFAAAMRSVFRAGGDTDSIGAVVGAIIGAQCGARRLPSAWRDEVQHGAYLQWLADRLAQPRTNAPAPAGDVVHVTGDVSARTTDAVVNAWNRNALPVWLLVPQGVSRAIRRAGGAPAIRAVSRRAPIPLGGAVETAAAGMACQWLVHAAAINLVWHASESSVRRAADAALGLCEWLGARSVALPVLGAGSGGLSHGVARRVMLEVIEQHRHRFDTIELVALCAGSG